MDIRGVSDAGVELADGSVVSVACFAAQPDADARAQAHVGACRARLAAAEGLVRRLRGSGARGAFVETQDTLFPRVDSAEVHGGKYTAEQTDPVCAAVVSSRPQTPRNRQPIVESGTDVPRSESTPKSTPKRSKNTEPQMRVSASTAAAPVLRRALMTEDPAPCRAM